MGTLEWKSRELDCESGKVQESFKDKSSMTHLSLYLFSQSEIKKDYAL